MEALAKHHLKHIAGLNIGFGFIDLLVIRLLAHVGAGRGESVRHGQGGFGQGAIEALFGLV